MLSNIIFTWDDFIDAHVSGSESRGPHFGRLLGSAALRMILGMRAMCFLRKQLARMPRIIRNAAEPSKRPTL